MKLLNSGHSRLTKMQQTVIGNKIYFINKTEISMTLRITEEIINDHWKLLLALSKDIRPVKIAVFLPSIWPFPLHAFFLFSFAPTNLCE